MYKTILVPHGGTDAGDEALKHAINAARESSKIIILHIVEAIQAPPSFALSSSEREDLLKSIDDANEEIRKDMEKRMEKSAQQCKDSGIAVEVKVEIGDAAEHILEFVEKNKVDLIVMSKRRKLKGMKKLLSLGSVSRKVVENVTCPVTLIDIEKVGEK
ncbi:universal stress protein [Nitrosopumilus adriaticus]|uniref:UspA domain-containing protein n=1 Tax=Nitrosopumilus adriaticus TaxID=1580092 RepID=A0A0D5C408_9ARCH|nr:universal stress protein [Nitrosopumilus adriaticus]AJW71539.1 UspA domain-containing protein [Nitrosopumilus adriaticus]MBT8172581.1 universal stress protein [Nitrosopumilus sp.]